MTTQDYVDADRFVTEAICRWDFSEREMLVLEFLRGKSFARGRLKARIPRQRYIAELTGLGENHVSATIRGLKAKRVIQDHEGCLLILLNTASWRVPPRFNLTSEHAALDQWLNGLDPEDPDWFPEPNLAEAFAEASAKEAAQLQRAGYAQPNHLPRRRTGEKSGAVSSSRSDPGQDAVQDTLSCHCRDSAGSTPGHTATTTQPAAIVPRARQGQSESPGSETQAIPRSDGVPESGRSSSRIGKIFPNRELGFEGSDPASETAGTGPKPDLPESGTLNAFNAFNASTALVLSERAFKTAEALKRGSKGERPESCEEAFMAKLAGWLGEKAMANWGGFWRNRWRKERHLVECCLERLILRLGSSRPIHDRGAWMRSEFDRGMRLVR